MFGYGESMYNTLHYTAYKYIIIRKHTTKNKYICITNT